MTGTLHAEWLSPLSDDATPFVLLHGFTQTGRAWGRFGELLAAERPTLAIDLPGHGGSDAVRANLPETADLVAETIDSMCGGPAIVLGYSMGGRIALHLALRRPDALVALVLVSTTAGLDVADERAVRRAADELLADRIEQIGIDAFLDEWLAQPLFASLDDTAAMRDERRRNSPEGLASSLRLAGTGTQEPLWAELHRIEVPTLVVVGAHDEKFTALGHRLVDAIGGSSSLVVIDDAGHNAPLERPSETTATIRGFVRMTTGSP